MKLNGKQCIGSIVLACLVILGCVSVPASALLNTYFQKIVYYDARDDWAYYQFDLYYLEIIEHPNWLEFHLRFVKPTTDPNQWGVFYFYFDTNNDGVKTDLYIYISTYGSHNIWWTKPGELVDWVKFDYSQGRVPSMSDTDISGWVLIDFLVSKGFNRSSGFSFDLQLEWNVSPSSRKITDNLFNQEYSFYVYLWYNYVTWFLATIIDWILDFIESIFGAAYIAGTGLSTLGLMATKYKKYSLILVSGYLAVPSCIAGMIISVYAGVALFMMTSIITLVSGLIGYLTGQWLFHKSGNTINPSAHTRPKK